MVTTNSPTAAAELAALFKAFLKTKTAPYSVWGPNSNTYARALLENAGFTVSVRYATVLEDGAYGNILRFVSWDPAHSYAKPIPREENFRIGGYRLKYSEEIGPTATVGWKDPCYGGTKYDKWGNKK